MLYVLEQQVTMKAGLTMHKNDKLFDVFIIFAHIGVYVYYKHKQLIIKKCNADGAYIMDLKSILIFWNDNMIDDMNKIFFSYMHCINVPRGVSPAYANAKGLVINYGDEGGATNWENRGS